MTEIEQGTEDNFELEIFKTVLIGDSAVGKTSIISAFTKGFFDENQEVTTSANYSSKALYYEPYEKGCHFQIWDTCGQEKYRSLNYIFYKDAKIAILVYDITQRKSYQSIVEYWYDEVKQKAAKDTLIVLCANKSDLIEDEIVDPVLAAKWAKGFDVPFFQISAKNIKGIRDLFVDLGQIKLNRMFDFSEINRKLEMGDKEGSIEGNNNNDNKESNNKKEKTEKNEKKNTNKDNKKEHKHKSKSHKKNDNIKLGEDELFRIDEYNSRSRCC